MEIKVVCPCGTKYKFPVQPVNGRMPQAIACPSCGVDNTELANQAIAAQSGAAPAVPVGVMLPSSSPPPVPGLRIAAAAPSSPPPLPPVQSAPPPVPQPRPVPAPIAPSDTRSASSGSTIKKVLSISLTVVLVAIGIYAIYSKWSRRIGRWSSFVEAVSSDPAISTNSIHWTLPDDDGSMLLIKSDSHTNVATVLAGEYAKLTRRQMTVVSEEQVGEDEDAELLLHPAFKGVVHVEGPMEWRPAYATNLAAAVSRQLHTTVVLAIMGDDAESGEVTIYEDGEKKFRQKHWYEIKSFTEDGIKEFTEREGEAWAATHGFVAAPTNSMDSDMLTFEDVNQLVLNLGIDVSEPPEQALGLLAIKPAQPVAARPPRQ